MARDKVGNKDQKDNSIGANNVIDGTLGIDELKIQDSGDASAVNGETLPLEHNVPGVSIYDAITAITGVLNIISEKHTSDGFLQDFLLANTVDTSSFYLVFFNGQMQKNGVSDDFQFTVSDTTLSFNYTPEAGKEIFILYVAL